MRETQQDGLFIRKVNDKKIMDVGIFGERSTGTNLLNIVMKNSFGFLQAKDYGWKHGQPSFLAARESTLFLVSLRNAIDWSVSLYARPRNASRNIRALSYLEFIKSPWLSEIQKSNRDTYPSGAILQQDRHPITGMPYANIFDMRKAKIQSWIGLIHRNVNLAIIRHETFMSERGKCIEAIADFFNLEIAKDGPSEVSYFFKRRKHEEHRRAEATKIVKHSLSYFDSLIDWEFEARIGYKKDIYYENK